MCSALTDYAEALPFLQLDAIIKHALFTPALRLKPFRFTELNTALAPSEERLDYIHLDEIAER